MSTFRHSWIAFCHVTLWLTGLFGACAPGPAIEIIPSAELVTSEGGKSVRLAVSLLQAPRGTVTVSATSSDPSEASVSGPLTFDASNWQVPQVFLVKGQDDTEVDGDATYDVTIEARQHTFRPHEAFVEVLSFVNVDDDVASFHGIGDLPSGEAASYASAVSAAGDIVVGWSRTSQGDEAFRWTAESGIKSLGGNQSRANDVSANGQVIVGSVAEPSYQYVERAAARWRTGSPIEIIPPYAPYASSGGPILFYPVDGTVALNSGALYGTCIQRNAYGDRLGCHISEGNEPSLSRGSSELFAGDEAGHVVGTTDRGRRGPPIGSHAYQGGLLSVQLEYPLNRECIIPHECAAQARAFSTDPVTIVGTALVPPAGQTTFTSSVLIHVAFAVTEGEGATRLEDLAGGDQDSGAYAIDASGRVIGGFSADADGRRATVWVDRAPRLLTDAVAAAGGKVPAGWILSEVRAISDDGLTFVGNGSNPAGEPEAFVVVLPAAL